MVFEEIYQGMDLEELERKLHNLTFQMDLSFTEILKKVYEGNGKGIFLMLWEKCKETLYIQVEDIKNIFITIVIIILISAVFSTFKDTFQNAQIAEISFYINYLLLMIIFTNIFGNVLSMGEETLKNMEEFMRIFFPAFFLIVGSTAGIGTGIAYYQIAGGVIYLVEWCLGFLLLPAISAYMLFVIMNGIWEEEKLTLLLELFQKGIRFLLKISLGVLTGAGMIQSMIIPIMDRVKGESIYKAVEAIPGIGDAIGGTAEVVLGTAVLIKNGIGLSGTIFCFALCLVPLIQTGTIVLMYKLVAAVIQPVSDKRVIGCIESVSEGCRLLMKIIFTTSLLFLITIVIVTTLTSL